MERSSTPALGDAQQQLVPAIARVREFISQCTGS
jgi:hypothetical protein